VSPFRHAGQYIANLLQPQREMHHGPRPFLSLICVSGRVADRLDPDLGNGSIGTTAQDFTYAPDLQVSLQRLG
jgi:hypothetical protein